MYGSGWGHGIGMSQWGAYGLAQRGWSHEQILTHYYTGTTIGPAPGVTPDLLRVGLTWDRTSIRLEARSGQVSLRFGKPGNPVRHQIPTNYTWTIRPVDGHFRLYNAKDELVETAGGPKWKLFVTYGGNDAQVRIPEAGRTYGRGHVELDVYRPCASCSWFLRAVGIMTPDEYVYGLGEVSSTWPMESMKAQAVASRSYALHSVNLRGQHRTDHGNCNCGLYPSSVDQYYMGWDKELQGPGWLQAVDDTRGQVVLHDGEIALTMYMASSGGHTESNENVWFGSPVPYLRGVCDPGDYVSSNPHRTWTSQLTAGEMGDDLARYGYDVGDVTAFTSVERSRGGRVVWVTVNGTGGSDGTSERVSGRVLAGAFGLKEDRVWFDSNRNVEGAIRAEYDRLMCAPGLPTTEQTDVTGGASQRFEDGAIYFNASRGTAHWLHGEALGKYLYNGGPGGVLGLPRTGQVALTPAGCEEEGACWRVDFMGGRIYFKRDVGSFTLHGRVLENYLGRDGATGPLGFPTSGVKELTGGALRATFEQGRITCHPEGRCLRS